MLQIITGDAGKGKTKVLIDKANNDVKVVSGSIVFLDNNNKHMYELSNRVRLINCTDYGINNQEMFAGFVLGILSQDHDIQKMYIDNFSTVTFSNPSNIKNALDTIKNISERFSFDVAICFATDANSMPEEYKSNIVAAL